MMIKLFDKTTTPVVMEVFMPPSGVASNGASVVVAYGTDGLSPSSKPLIEDFCTNALAHAGFTVALPRFLEITKTAPGVEGVTKDLKAANLAKWTEAIVEAVNWSNSNQGSDRIGLIGFSLGGYMAARAALATPVKLLVDFFGPMTQFGKISFPLGEEFTEAKAKGLPPTQIHHGKNDFVVDPSESAFLKSWLDTAGISCALHDQYQCGHPQQPKFPWTSAEQKQTAPAVLSFLSSL